MLFSIQFLLLFISGLFLIKGNEDCKGQCRDIEVDDSQDKAYLKEDLENLLRQDLQLFIETSPPRKRLNEKQEITLKEKEEGHSLNDVLMSKDTFVIHDKVLEIVDSEHSEEQLDKSIKKAMQVKESKYPISYIFYGDPKKIITENYPWPSLLSQNANLIDYSIISNQIGTDPELIQIESKICLLANSLIKIKNFNEKSMIIRGVKSDLYQVKLFLYKNGRENLAKINTHFPRTIPPHDDITLQLVSLSDEIGVINGSLYIELNNNKILIVPIVIKSKENPYRILPVFIYNRTKEKDVAQALTIFNPHSKALVIKEVNHSFKSILIYSATGLPIPSSSNSSSVSSSLIEIQPKASRTLLYVTLTPESSGIEYGVLHLLTNKGSILIPIFIKAEVKGFKLFPSALNFGLIDLNSPIKRAIPLSVTNLSQDYLSFKPLFTDYDEQFITFHAIAYNNSEVVVLAPNDTLCLGYTVFNPLNYNKHTHLLLTRVSGSFFIETNYTFPYSISALKYRYMLDKGTFANQFKTDLRFYSKEAISSFEVITQIKSPFNVESIPEVSRKRTPFYKDRIMKVYIKKVKFAMTNNNIDFAFRVLNTTKILNDNRVIMPLLLSQHFYSVLPIRLFNDTLDFLYCEDVHSFSQCYSSHNQSIFQNLNRYNSNPLNVSLSLGKISLSDTAKISFYIINEQETALFIEDAVTDNSALSVELVGYEELNGKGNTSIAANEKSVGQALKRRERVKVPSKSAAVFRILVHSDIEASMKETINMHFDEDVMIAFTVKATVMKGTLYFTPSSIRFEPGFPGLFQRKFLSSKSSYNFPIEIASVRSSDQRIIPEILNKNIYPNDRTEILKITFDSSQVHTENNYMKGDYTVSRLTDTSKSYLTHKDLYLWKEKQKLWERLGSEGKTEINAVITIKTSIQEEDIQARAFLTKPSLVKKDEINFGLVQIGETADAYIEGFNPSDEMIDYQILLAHEEYSDIHNDKSTFNKNKSVKYNSSEKVIVFDCKFCNKTGIEITSSHSNKSEDYSHNIIIIEESDIDYEAVIDKSFPKEELIKKLYLNSNNVTIKQLFLKSKKIICRSQLITKTSIVLANDTFLSDIIFSHEFNEEIETIRLMTTKQPDFINQPMSSSVDDTFHFKHTLIEFLSSLLPFSALLSSKGSEAKNKSAQIFFLPHHISSQTFNVSPHQKFKIGPILYHPTSTVKSSSTLFIKNNLTVLYPIKLIGKGGNGIPVFSIFTQPSPHFKLIDNNKIMIEIDREIFENEMFNKKFIERRVTLTNTGTLPLKISNITIDHFTCEKMWLKISKCEAISLDPDGSIDINLEINPDFNFYMAEKEIFFESKYQLTSLKVVVNINKDLLMIKNKLFSYTYMQSFGFLSLILSLFIGFSILKIVVIEKEEIQAQVVYRLALIFNCYELSEQIRFGNLIIKAYRKNDKDYIENFIRKQIDKPGSVDIEAISSVNTNEKRKSMKRKLKSSGSKVNSGASKNSSDASSIRKISKDVNESGGGGAKKDNTSTLKAKEDAKGNTSDVNRLQKIQENKDEEKVGTKNLTDRDSIHQSTKSLIKDLPPRPTTTQAQKNTKVKEESYQPKPSNHNMGYYHYNNKYHKNSSYHSNVYYSNNNIKKKDRHYHYNNYNYDYYQSQNQLKHHQKNKFNILPSHPSTGNLSVNTQNSHNQQSDPSSENQLQLKLSEHSNENQFNLAMPIDSNAFTKQSSSLERREEQKRARHTESNKEEVIKAKTKEESQLIDQDQLSIKKEANVSQSNNSFSNNITQPYMDNKEEQMTSMEPFDFSNIFLKNSNESNDNNGLYSENEEMLNGQQHPQTDSGFEDIQFNINSMVIGSSNANMGVCFPGNGNELTDEDLKNQPDKPYFKNIINENFENKVFYANPFIQHSTKGILTELINEEETENEMINPALIDELAEGEEGVDEDEREPLWNIEAIDIQKEGYFDEKGHYKVKQMDFNFNLI